MKKTIPLVVTVEYDPEVTDPNALAEALDRLMETATSTPFILEEQGDPSIGEFYPIEIKNFAPDIDVVHVAAGGVPLAIVERDENGETLIAVQDEKVTLGVLEDEDDDE